MSLRSSSQQPPVKYVKSIGSSRESNPSRRICHLRAVPLGNVADKSIKHVKSSKWNSHFARCLAHWTDSEGQSHALKVSNRKQYQVLHALCLKMFLPYQIIKYQAPPLPPNRKPVTTLACQMHLKSLVQYGCNINFVIVQA